MLSYSFGPQLERPPIDPSRLVSSTQLLFSSIPRLFSTIATGNLPDNYETNVLSFFILSVPVSIAFLPVLNVSTPLVGPIFMQTRFPVWGWVLFTIQFLSRKPVLHQIQGHFLVITLRLWYAVMFNKKVFYLG